MGKITEFTAMPDEIKQAQSVADLWLLARDKLKEIQIQDKMGADFENDAALFEMAAEYYLWLSDREHEIADQEIDLSQEPHKEDEFIEDHQ